MKSFFNIIVTKERETKRRRWKSSKQKRGMVSMESKWNVIKGPKSLNLRSIGTLSMTTWRKMSIEGRNLIFSLSLAWTLLTDFNRVYIDPLRLWRIRLWVSYRLRNSYSLFTGLFHQDRGCPFKSSIFLSLFGLVGVSDI